MKTQISRRTFDEKNRYSSIYQQMGRMITDADWNELSDLVKHQLNSALYDVIGCGVPRDRGAVSQISEDEYVLKWGHVYVAGIHGEIRPDHADNLSDFNFAAQADFPAVNNLEVGEHRLYVDLWERTITQLEDNKLLDPGLKGADTCTRTQVMAQVKSCSLDYDREDIEGDSPLNPCIGKINVNLSVREGQTLSDPCDPCSEELALPEDIGNFLFRIEVHDVIWSDDAIPKIIGLTLKWSSENAAEAYAINLKPPGYQSNRWAYEFFSGSSDTPAENMTTEKHLGHHLMQDFDPSRGILTDGFKPENAPGMSLVRRWDGFAVFELDGTDWSLSDGYDRGRKLSTGYSDTTHGYVDIASDTKINLDKLSFSFSLDEPIALAGDFWIAEVREAIHEAGSILLDDALPEGIKHHYWLLGKVRVELVDDENVITEFVPEGQSCKQIEFPPVTDITSSDVCYKMPECGAEDGLLPATVRSLLENKLGDDFPDANTSTKLKNIIDALMCQHTAVTLPLEKNNQLCPTLQAEEVVSVQDALNILCRRGVDGCATYTVFPQQGWESVFNLIADGESAHICFREGEYPLTERLVIANKGHLTIGGAGKGTHIYSDKESVLYFDDCKSVMVEKMFIEGRLANVSKKHIQHLNGALTFNNCQSVGVSHNTLRCASGIGNAATCLTITHSGSRSGSASVTNNKVEVGHRQIGLMLNNLTQNCVEHNRIVTRSKPQRLTLSKLLKNKQLAAKARRYLINEAEVRNFESERAANKKNIQLDSNNQRRIKIDSPIAANIWKEVILDEIGQSSLKSNQELLNITKGIGNKVVSDRRFRKSKRAFARWYTSLKRQNPSVSYKGIVCGGKIATDLRILNNVIEGAQQGIQVGLSDRSQSTKKTYIAGRVIIENNTIRLRVPPLVIHRRGGIFVGNCNHLTISQNQINVQRYQWTSQTPIEAVRVFGQLGRMMIIDQNYATNCSVGFRIVPLDANLKSKYQWLVADNLTVDVGQIISCPVQELLTLRNNIK